MSTREELLKQLKSISGEKSIKLPLGIEFEALVNDNTIRMTLKKCAIGRGEKNSGVNMQENNAAFEGWAVILYSYLKKDIELDIEDDQNIEIPKDYLVNGHYSRFLYRALRFSEQYSSWFSLSDKLRDEVKTFDEWLRKNKKSLTNNIPRGEAGDSHKSENQIEGWFASEYGKKILRNAIINGAEIEENNVFRQLPVGLFLGEEKNDKRVFTGGKSAIDLWTWNKNDFYTIELKHKNTMVGIITEIFFYANYLNDLLVKENFVVNRNVKSDKKSDRGYKILLQHMEEQGKFDRIQAIMLADDFHPLINKNVVNVLNEGKETAIQYYKCNYKIKAELNMSLNDCQAQ